MLKSFSPKENDLHHRAAAPQHRGNSSKLTIRMQLVCNPGLGAHLTRNTQRVREISEGWFLAEGYCLNCESPRVRRTPASTEFLDFECPACGQGYELKSAARAHTSIVQDGGYDSLVAI